MDKKAPLIAPLTHIATAAGYQLERSFYHRQEASGKTNYWFLSKKNQKKPELMIFVHGAGCDSLYPQLSFFKELFSSGHSLFTFDLDGHGSQSSTLLHPKTMTSSISQAIQVAKKLSPHTKIHLIAYSLGGALSLYYLSKPHDALASVIILSSPLKIRKFWHFLPEFLILKDKLLWQQLKLYSPWELSPPIGPFRRQEYPIRLASDCPQKWQGKDLVYTFREIFKYLNEKTSYEKIKERVHLYYGTSDPIAPLSDARNLKAKIPHSQLHLARGRTHLTILCDPRVSQRICQWIQNS